MPLQITDTPSLDEFIELSWHISAGDPHWIPPMRARLHQELIGADAFGEYGRLQLFGCESGGRLAGRIVALLNPRLADASGQVVGQVGYFEAIDDEQVAAGLFGAAFEWLRAAGAREVWGPMNGGAHRTHRLMTSGFDRRPYLFEPRNPPYYPRLFERAGFERRYSWYSIDVSSDQLRSAIATLPIFQVPERAKNAYDVVWLDPSDARNVLSRLHALLDAMWSGHLGYASLDLAEFIEVFGPALSLMTDRDLQVAVERRTGRDIGCAFTYPDYGPEVRALAGDPSKWGAWRQTGPHPRRLVLHTVGVAREVRGSGLAMWPIRRAIEHCVEAYSEGVIALVIEDFHVLRKIGPPTREHALFARPLD